MQDERVMKLLARAEDMFDRLANDAVEGRDTLPMGDWLMDYKILMRDLRREAELAVLAEQMADADLDAAEAVGNIVRMRREG